MIDPDIVWLLAEQRRAIERIERAERDLKNIEALIRRLKAADDAKAAANVQRMSSAALSDSLSKLTQHSRIDGKWPQDGDEFRNDRGELYRFEWPT